MTVLGSVVVGLVASSGAPGQTTFTAELSGRNTIPPANTQASGSCTATLSADQTTLILNCVHDVQDVTDGHIHVGPAGQSGEVVFEYDGASPVSATLPMTAADVADLMAERLYINIHSDQFTSEEVRGQLVPSSEGTTTGEREGSGGEFMGLCGPFLFPGMVMSLGGLACMRLVRRRGAG